MDLVCGSSEVVIGSGSVYMGSAFSNTIDNIKKRVTNINSEDDRKIARYARELRLNATTVRSAYLWSKQYGPQMDRTNVKQIIKRYESFKVSRSGQNNTSDVDAGLASRDAYFQKLGWQNHADWLKTTNDGYKKTPYSKADYMAWAEGQKTINRQANENTRLNDIKRIEGSKQKVKIEQYEALKEMGLTPAKSYIPFAIAGAVALFAFK